MDVDSEQQKVTVSGNVDSSALIKKLLKGGKYAEPWSQKSNQNQKSQQDDKNTKGQKGGLNKGLKNQHNLASFSLEDHDDCEDVGDDDEEEDEELRFMRERVGLLGQANDSTVKKALAAANNSKAVNGGVVGGNVGKKTGGNLSQNPGVPPDHKNINFAAINKVNGSTHLGGGAIGNSNGAEGKKWNEINGFGLGLQGHGTGVGLAGNNGLGFQSQPNTFQGSGLPSSAFGPVAQRPPPMMTNIQGYQNYPSSMGMNMNNRPNIMLENRYMQPQMMYHRSPPLHPYTGYYHQYPPQPINYPEHPYTGYHHQYPPLPINYPENVDAHVFNDQSPNACAIM